MTTVSLGTNLLLDTDTMSSGIGEQNLSYLWDGSTTTSVSGTDAWINIDTPLDIYNGCIITTTSGNGGSLYLRWSCMGYSGWIGNDGAIKTSQSNAAADPIILSSGIVNDIIFDKGVKATQFTAYLTNFDISEMYFTKKTSGGLIQAGAINTNYCRITNDAGTISIDGDTITIKDANGNIRVKLGKLT